MGAAYIEVYTLVSYPSQTSTVRGLMTDEVSRLHHAYKEYDLKR